MPFNDGQASNLFNLDFARYQEQACEDNGREPPNYDETVCSGERPLAPMQPDAMWEDMKKRPIGRVTPNSHYTLVVVGCFSYVYYADGHVYHSYVTSKIAGRTNEAAFVLLPPDVQISRSAGNLPPSAASPLSETGG
jgi:hypothetical protein